MYNKKLVLALLLKLSIFTICMPAISEAATLYSIIVADTLDKSLGEDFQYDVENMSKLVDEICKYTDLKAKKIKITGSSVTPENIIHKIVDLNIKDDDVVMFYYSGHGYRTHNMKTDPPWPILKFSQTNYVLASSYVMDVLEDKKQRLLISMTDCCNKFITKSNPLWTLESSVAAAKTDKNLEALIKQNYRRLFLETKGTIKIASSQPGESSYNSDEADGGQYTVAFMKGLRREVSSSEFATWEKVLDRADSYVDDEEQHPIWRMQILEDALF